MPSTTRDGAALPAVLEVPGHQFALQLLLQAGQLDTGVLSGKVLQLLTFFVA
jgi:hypothetical protein